MSILRLSTEVVARQVAASAASAPEPLPPPVAPPPPVTSPPLKSTAVQNALALLTKYIPTEIVTIYVPALGVAHALKYEPDGVYIAFLIATPVVLLLVLQGQRTLNGLPLLTWATTPKWRFIASVISFAVWGLAVPEPPFFKDQTAASVIVGFFAMAVSMLLGLIEPIAER